MSDTYGVRFVGDHELPEGQDWVFVEVDGGMYFVVKESRVTPEALDEAWAAYRRMIFGPKIPRPRPALESVRRAAG